MANTMYPKAAEGFGDGTINWTTDDIRCMLVKTGASYNAAHDFLDDLSGSYDNGRVAASLGSKTCTLGIFDAADNSLVATAATSSIALAFYKYNASDASARLVLWMDTMTGFPFTPAAGQTVNLVWDNGANKIYKMGG